LGYAAPMSTAMSWLNEPGKWSAEGDVVRAITELKTDFWRLLRLAHLDMPASVEVGVMCCSPERAGLEATFRGFRVGEPISRAGLE
jgi:regulation of enolase protein 1 (concanavalin A-like superfamily)